MTNELNCFNQDYANCYDLLYRDKPYAAEAGFVASRVQEYLPKAKSCLDFGSGSGRHDEFLVKRFETLAGIDQSKFMVEKAKERLALYSDKVDFFVGDFTNYKLQKTFDIVVSLFHVLSYQTQDEQILNMFNNAHSHLNDGGLFLCDFWYTPGVQKEPPSLRVKRCEDEHLRFTRIAEPDFRPGNSVVDINYELFWQNKPEGSWQNLREKHTMRHFDIPELQPFLSKSGFDILESGEWMTGKKPTDSTWSVYFLAQKKKAGGPDESSAQRKSTKP